MFSVYLYLTPQETIIVCNIMLSSRFKQPLSAATLLTLVNGAQ